MKQDILQILSRNNLKFSGFLIGKSDGKKFIYYELDLTLYFRITGLPELKFGLILWKYCASKLTIQARITFHMGHFVLNIAINHF